MSHGAKDSLFNNSFLTPSSGISLNTRVFLIPCKQREQQIQLEQKMSSSVITQCK